MADPFWDPIFARLQDDLELIGMIIRDTPDSLLFGLVAPNPRLQRQCAPFLKGGRIANRQRVADIVLRYCRGEAALRRVLLLEWVAANPTVMSFTTVSPDGTIGERLEKGEFGPPAKVAILSRIDPREAARITLDTFLRKARETAPQETRLPHPSEESSSTASPPETHSIPPQPPAGEPALKEELRSLRKRIREIEEDRSRLQSKVSAQGEELAGLRKTNDAMRNEITGLKSRLEGLSNQSQDSHPVPPSPPVVSREPRPDSRLLEERIGSLEAAIGRRDATIERLEGELDRLRDSAKDRESGDRQAESLKRALKGAEDQIRQLRGRIVGKLLGFSSDPQGGGKLWVLDSPGAEPCAIRGSFPPGEEPLVGEWVAALPDGTGGSFSLASLELSQKTECIGTLHVSGNDGWVETDEGCIPIHCPYARIPPGSVVSGTLLPAFGDRPWGVFRLRSLNAPANEAAERGLSFSRIRKALGLINFDRAGFTKWLRETGIPFSEAEDRIEFESSADSVLFQLRTTLPTRPVCGRSECLSRAGIFPFPRKCKKDQVCSVCLEEPGSQAVPEPGELPNFHGERVLIIGGDHVGPRFKEFFGRFDLNVEWLSGFEDIGGVRAGMGGFDLVTVILRQISHTVLRELLAGAEISGVPICYCPRRGLSGVLAVLSERLGATRKP